MYLDRLKLKNFRAFEEVEILFDQPLSVVRGANHSGKTTIAQAIKLGLSKSCDGTDPRGAGAADKIREGAAKAEIELNISGKSPIEMRVSYGPGKVGRQQNIIGQQPGVSEAFADYLDRNQERLSCVLDADYFLSPKTDQKAILAALVLPTTYDFDDDIKILVEKHLGRQDWNMNPAVLIDWIYGDDRRGAYGERKLAKSVLASINIPPTPQKPEYTDKDEIQTRIYELRKKAMAESAKVKRGGTVQLGRAQQQVESLTADKQHQEETLANARKNYAEWDKQLLTPAATRKHQKLAANRTLYNSLQSSIDAKGKMVAESRTAQEIYREMLLDPICPTCTQPISVEFVEHKVAEFQKVIDNAEAAILSLKQQQGECGDVAGAERILAEDTDREAKRDGWNAEIVRLEDAIKRIEYELGNAEKLLDAAKADESNPPDTTVLEALNAELAEWEARLSPAIHYQATLAGIEASKQMRIVQQAKVNDLERLCSAFGKDGIKATLIQEHIDKFTERVNSVLSAWGYEAELNIEPYRFDVTTAEGKRLPVKELSGSEELMFAAALQCAIAIDSGIRMVVIDRADTFINAERGRLFTAVEGLLTAKLLDQAIIMVSDERTEAPEAAGVGFYRVAEGKVERL